MQQELYLPFPPEQLAHYKEKALQWAYEQESCLAYLTDASITYPFGGFPQLLAIGAESLFSLEQAPFDALYQLHQQQPGWLFGYFTYDLKNGIHPGLSSRHPEDMGFPSCQFFRPKHLLRFDHEGVLVCSSTDPQALHQAIENTAVPPLRPCQSAQLRQTMGKDEHLQKVQAVKNHILEGDCYELNLCMAFTAEGYQEDPLMLFRQLHARSPAPFTTFQRFGDHFLISASPERFLKKEGDRLLSQPIKGTIRRGASPEEDEQLRRQLADSEKDRAENMMIVDLVRNDLARSSAWGSVEVPELFGIYSFRQLHQMISSISSRLRTNTPFTEALKLAFPMGSMTGAPKHIVMQLIDRYENSRRSLYSGAAGYISPAGDFDFNVVIRSMLYNASSQRLSFSVGGAITWDSDPQQEWEECLLKASGMLQVLGASKADE
jgi:para-aminobenzoate synthetase component I